MPFSYRYPAYVSALDERHEDADVEEHLSLVHRGEVEPEVRQEGQGELQAGVEEEVDEVGRAQGLQRRLFLVAHLVERRKIEQRHWKKQVQMFLDRNKLAEGLGLEGAPVII